MLRTWFTSIRTAQEVPLRLGCPLLTTTPTLTAIRQFTIGFDHRDRERLHALWDRAIDSERWSEGELLLAFERAWEQWNGLPAVAYSSWSGAVADPQPLGEAPEVLSAVYNLCGRDN